MSRVSPGKLTRQELYDRVRERGKQQYILDEMIRLGFWPEEDADQTSPTAQLIRRENKLQKELSSLLAEQRMMRDRERTLKELRKQRMAESRRKRKENKERRERERQERAAAWRERQRSGIVYLGDGVSAGLNHREEDAARLAGYGLPSLPDAAAIAAAMDIDVGELRFMAFARRVSRRTHYRRFTIPKKTGGERLISAPMPRLKETQHWILEHILLKVPAHDAAHGFRVGRSIVTGAEPHTGADAVINLDLEDFFPTVTYRRIKGLFRSLGYSEQAATIFALVCSEPEIDEVELDGETWYVARGERHLPQGAPSSPAITNLLCRRLDRRLAGMAGKLGWSYTRYADDLTFSGRGPDTGWQIYQILRRARDIVEHEGFKVQDKKTRVMRRGRRQEVTGLTVNDRVGVDRKTLRRFRATLFQVEKDGPAGKRWGRAVGTPDDAGELIESLRGFAAFVAMVDAAKGKPLLERVERLIQQGYAPPKRRRPPKREPSWSRKKPFEETPAVAASADAAAVAAEPAETEVEAKKKPWWKFW